MAIISLEWLGVGCYILREDSVAVSWIGFWAWLLHIPQE